MINTHVKKIARKLVAFRFLLVCLFLTLSFSKATLATTVIDVVLPDSIMYQCQIHYGSTSVNYNPAYLVPGEYILISSSHPANLLISFDNINWVQSLYITEAPYYRTVYFRFIAPTWSPNPGKQWWFFDAARSSQFGITVDYEIDILTTNGITPVQALNDGPYCIGDDVHLSSKAAPGSTYVWSGPGGFTATTASVTINSVTASAGGIYTLTATSGCAITTTTNVVINTEPGPISGVTSICPGSSSQLTANFKDGIWSSSNAAILTVDASSGVITGITSGVAIVTYSGICGGPVYITKPITVSAIATAITGPSEICNGSTESYFSTPTDGTWTVTPLSGSATIDPMTGSVTAQGVGTVRISYSQGVCPIHKTIAIQQLISPVISTQAITQRSILSTVGGNGTAGFAGDGGNVSAAILKYPTNIFKDHLGNIFVTDNSNYRIRKIDVSGNITTFVGSGYPGNYGDGGPATAANILTPRQVAEDSHGNIYFAESAYNRIRKISTTGIITVFAGTTTGGFSGDGGPATAAKFNNPSGIAIDANDNVYIADAYNHRIRRIDPTGIINTIAGNGTTAYSGTNGSATAAGINTPYYLYINGSDLYFSDYGNFRINKIDNLTGIISLVFGNGSSFYSGDGIPATAASMTYPYGITTDETRNLYFVDRNQNLIRRVNSDGIVTTIAGTGATGSAGDGEPALAGTMYFPIDLTFDKDGNLLFLEYQNSKIRKISNTSGITDGVLAMCTGTTRALESSVAAGTWSSSNSSVASVGTTGIVTAISAGTTVITFTKSSVCGVATTTLTINVNPLVSDAAITGDTLLCLGNTTALGNYFGGGAWTSSNTAVATINAAGMITARAIGTSVVSYSVEASCGLTEVTEIVTVNPSANAGTISGPAGVCTGKFISLSGNIGGGSWSSSDPAMASVNATGTVTGITAGTLTFTYTIITSCGTVFSTKTVTVYPAPDAGAVSGPSTVCQGGVGTFSTTATGGAWGSGITAVATVNASGMVTGRAEGTTQIFYMVSSPGCAPAVATTTITVSPLPTVGNITGTTEVCEHITTALENTTSDGVWSSANPAIASVDASGNVTGVVQGNTTISYAVTNGCGTVTVTTNFIVNVGPDAGTLSGVTIICNDLSSTLSSTVAGGTWSSSNNAIASVGTSGSVSGISAGDVLISYTTNNGCGDAIATTNFTVFAPPVAGTISASETICIAGSATFTSTGSGGVWSSSNNSIATIDAGGTLSTIAAGTATISYTVTNVCSSATATTNVTIEQSQSPGTISGSATLCTGSNTLLIASGTSGGVWTSTNTTAAVVSSTGTVSGLNPGATTISYTLTNSCGAVAATHAITIVPGAGAGIIGGNTNLCTGVSSTLSTTGGAGGVWSSGNTSVATISATGVVNAIAPGDAPISYSLTNTCGTASSIVAVAVSNPPSAPGTISGTTQLCQGSTTSLATTGSEGEWSSSQPTRATINASGTVSGIGAGVVFISYTVSNSCNSVSAIWPMTINPTPASVNGLLTVCPGATTILTTSPGGGTWSSPDANVSVIPTNGKVTGITPGVATINYSLATGCGISASLNVTPPPGAIGGVLAACPGTTAMLSNLTTGGTWSTISTSKATVDATSGLVTAISPGVVIITYTASAGCYNTTAFTVSASPAVISGGLTLCTGTTTDLNCSTAGGLWTSSDPTVATVNPVNGIVQSVAGTGTTLISYTVGSLCARTVELTVAIPTANVGTPTLCLGQPASVAILSNPTPGGVWSCSNASRIAISPASGVMKGLSTGTATITYKLGTSCINTTEVTVNAAVATITGPVNVCPGATVTLANTTPGGTWSSSDLTKATTNAATGDITGVAAGNTTVTYQVSEGCFKTRTLAVLPAPISITGANTLLTGETAVLSCGPSGGTWSSNNPAAAIINAANGATTAISAGVTTIFYTLSNGCQTTHDMTTLAARPGENNPATNDGGAMTLTIAPNPTSGTLTIAATEPGTFYIYTIDGKELANYPIIAPTTTISLPQHLAAGVYMVRFTGNNGTTKTMKLIYQP